MKGNGQFVTQEDTQSPTKLDLVPMGGGEVAIQASIGDRNHRLGIFKDGCLMLNRLPLSVANDLGIKLDGRSTVMTESYVGP